MQAQVHLCRTGFGFLVVICAFCLATSRRSAALFACLAAALLSTIKSAHWWPPKVTWHVNFMHDGVFVRHALTWISRLR
jgi:hypothetical protein